MLLNLSCYELKLECYNFRMVNVIPVATTKKIATEHTQKEIKKEFTHFTTKKLIKHKEDRDAGNEEIKSYKQQRKKIAVTEVPPYQ